MLWKTLVFKTRSTCLFHRRSLKWLFGGNEQESYASVVDGLKRVYRTKLLPLEETYLFHDFHSPKLNDADFESKPLILFMGQYSTGKTTLIKHLLGCEFPGMRIGPEPTTDRFIAIMHDDKEGVIPGNALVVDPKKQFRPLSKFGNAFLNRFQCSTVNSSVLRTISIVDTPGILSGEKQRVDRGYDFTGVLAWFAERVDRIILLFDAHKLDISDEFRRSIEALHGHDDKIRIVLNKSDMVDHQQLMRVYGALMWSLGKILKMPEVARVYIGSFWDQQLRNDLNRRLFEDEEQDLFRDIQSLPRNAALRKLNDLIKRARLAKEQLMRQDFARFSSLKPHLLEAVDRMLANDIARLMAMIPHEALTTDSFVKGGAFEAVGSKVGPFGYKRGEGVDAGAGDLEWIVGKKRAEYDAIFKMLNPVEGKVMRTDVKLEMMKSKLPSSVLGKIYGLADVDQDGLLDADEFALMMYLISVKLDGHDLPSELPSHLIPPLKRKGVQQTASISEKTS
ncbi:EH domain-containing protein 1 isoform X2 [Cryptotermes secundus]|uniref:EH domain-containing protein 1 isoform X2 n=1 Tax=Cryptotermes secundus TaxID=105785 RepID=UPI000CD7DC03|nr:EH domain-containing protein 1 isoform X2 [Cryptotermes secundus]